MTQREWKKINRNMLSQWVKEGEYVVVDAGQEQPQHRGFLVARITEKRIYISVPYGATEIWHPVSELLEHGLIGGFPVVDPRDPETKRFALLLRLRDTRQVIDEYTEGVKEFLEAAKTEKPTPAEFELNEWRAQAITHESSRLLGDIRRLRAQLDK